MASTSNQEQSKTLEAPPLEIQAPVPNVHPQERDTDPPSPPTVTSGESDSEWTGQNLDQTTTATTVASGSRPKSEEGLVPPNNGRTTSVSVQEQNGLGRYTSIRTPKPVILSTDGSFRTSRAQGLDWIVPTTLDSKRREKTVGERLEPTLVVAIRERDKYASNARIQGFALNACIGLQVAVGALTTGVAAAVSGKQVQIGVSILGGISTILASYLARMRGSNEPEFSNLRSRELDTFVREVEAWSFDHGHLIGSEYDDKINKFRERFENIIRTEGQDKNGGSFQSAKLDKDKNTPQANGDATNKV